MTRGTRYGLRFANTRLVPTVEVTDWDGTTWDSTWGVDPVDHVVKTVRGWTRAHAFDRAVRWARAHGDPR